MNNDDQSKDVPATDESAGGWRSAVSGAQMGEIADGQLPGGMDSQAFADIRHAVYGRPRLAEPGMLYRAGDTRPIGPNPFDTNHGGGGLSKYTELSLGAVFTGTGGYGLFKMPTPAGKLAAGGFLAVGALLDYLGGKKE